jgi:predicted phage terminase large subunit-like protein
MVMPIFYQYGQNYYLVDCICDNSVDFSVQYNRLTQKIVKYNVQMVEFESNQGGQRIAYEIRRRLKEMNHACNITTRPTETNKETRIIVNSEWIKLHVLFRDESLIDRKSDYEVFMKQLFGWSQAAKNEHDDVPDALANFVKYVEKTFNGARAEAIQNPLRYL